MTTVLQAAISRAEAGWHVPLDTYSAHVSDLPGAPFLTGMVRHYHGENLVQHAIDVVRVNRWPDNRRTNSFSGYLRQAFARELTREATLPLVTQAPAAGEQA